MTGRMLDAHADKRQQAVPHTEAQAFGRLLPFTSFSPTGSISMLQKDNSPTRLPSSGTTRPAKLARVRARWGIRRKGAGNAVARWSRPALRLLLWSGHVAPARRGRCRAGAQARGGDNRRKE